MKNIFNRKSVFVKSLSVWSAFAVIITTSAPAFAAGTAVLGGSADLQNLTRATMDKNDPNAAVFSSDAASAVLDWNRFNIGSGQSMSFNGAGTTFFNLVDGVAGRSQIDGIINGSGNVWVINPAGIAFGAGSSVNVGGLFAAAAGNLENAAALRDGTATMPAFSSFAGAVDATKGTFTANQVALLGKTVTAEGDFSGIRNLSISATGGAVEVDDVQGGKVSIELKDFTADASEVTLGDISIDGDLSVKSTGRIAAGAKATEAPAGKPMLLTAEKVGPSTCEVGNMEIEGTDIEIEGKLWAKEGKIDVLAYGNMDVNAEVEARDDVKLSARGDSLNVNGDVSSTQGSVTFSSYGSVDVRKNVSANQNVEIAAMDAIDVKGDVTAENGSAMIYSMYADTTIDGSVDSHTVSEIHSAYFGGTGDITVNGRVSSDGKALLGAGVDFCVIGQKESGEDLVGAIWNGGKGNIAVNGGGVVSAGSLVMLDTFRGNVKVEREGVVKTTGSGSELDIAAGVGYMDWTDGTYVPDEGDVTINGSVYSENDGDVFIAAGYGYHSEGNISVGADGSIDAGGNLYLYGGYGLGFGWLGRIMLNGDVAAGKDMLISAAGIFSSSQFTGVTSTGGIYAKDGDLSVNGGIGNVILMGDVYAKKAAFVADDYAESGYSGNVQILSTGSNLGIDEVTASGKGVTISGSAGDGVLTLGDITATDDIRVYLTDGSLAVKEGATVKTSGSKLRMGTGLATDGTPGGSGNVTVNGTLEASDLVQLHVEGQAIIGERGVAKATSDNGEVMVVVTGGGNLDVEGELSAAKAVYAVADGDVIVGKTGKVIADGEKGVAAVWASEDTTARGNVDVKGEVRGAMQSIVESYNGSVRVENGGKVVATDADGIAFVSSRGKEADIVIGGLVKSEGEQGVVAVRAATDAEGAGNVVITDSGRVVGGVSAEVIAGNGTGDVSVNGGVSAGKEVVIATKDGNIAINGEVEGGNAAMIIAGMDGGKGGNIDFGNSGHVSAGSFADLSTTGGNVRQSGSGVTATAGGYVEKRDLEAAVSSAEVNLRVYGDVGSGTYGYVAVDGRIFGLVSGSAALAAANGKPFVGGNKPTHAPSFNGTAVELMSRGSGDDQTFSTHVLHPLVKAVDWGSFSDNSSIVADGNLSIYTADALNPYGMLVAGQDLTVSAASFGDMSYLRAGGKLTINNVGHPSHPQIAYFESVNGKEPKINNQPNDMVIFVDGRLAGGNLNILNKFGADEAFMVETPELKSTQGIFGNPPFLHSDLDVANPMAVSAVDYLIQEVPRLTLSSDFPAEVDQNVEAVGLSQKDVYWFGQKGSDEKKASDEAAEKTAETDKGSEKPSDKTVALLR